MRALKLLVVTLGVLIVAGVVGLVAVMASRFAQRPAAPVAGLPAFGTSTVRLPTGARLLGTEGTRDRLILRIVLASGAQQLIVIDLASGKPLGTIELRPDP
jgi:hypothetical protein